MGNHRFRLSDMLPNYWFYKLKDMGRASRNQRITQFIKRNPPTSKTTASTTPKLVPPPNQAYLPKRTSYYFPSEERIGRFPHSPNHQKASDTLFPVDPPRKSKRRSRRRLTKPSSKPVASSVSANCNCRANFTSACKPESMPENSLYCHDYSDDDDDDDYDFCKPVIADKLEFESCQVGSSASDFITNVDSKSPFDRFKSFEDMDSVLELKLRPIATKPMKKEADVTEVDGRNANGKQGSYHHGKSPARRSIQRIKVRASSPRLCTKRLQAYPSQKMAAWKAAIQQKKGLMESFAVVKSSLDPRRDFKESMVEMIRENNLRRSKDLEELLACYLSLNSKEYHDVIIEVFEQIWFDLADIIL